GSRAWCRARDHASAARVARHVRGRTPYRRRAGTDLADLASSESAGVQRGDEDGARPDLVELVHHTVHLGAQHHGLYGDPPLAVQRRDGRRLDAGRQRAGVVEAVHPHVVREHYVPPGDQYALQTTYQLRDTGGQLGAVAPDEQRGRLEDRLAD